MDQPRLNNLLWASSLQMDAKHSLTTGKPIINTCICK